MVETVLICSSIMCRIGLGKYDHRQVRVSDLIGTMWSRSGQCGHHSVANQIRSMWSSKGLRLQLHDHGRGYLALHIIYSHGKIRDYTWYEMWYISIRGNLWGFRKSSSSTPMYWSYSMCICRKASTAAPAIMQEQELHKSSTWLGHGRITLIFWNY